MRLLAVTSRYATIAVAAVICALMFTAPACAQSIPSYGRPAVAPNAETIHGRIQSIESAFHITVLDDRGFVDDVTLRHGTVISPRGLRLAPGMEVTIYGVSAGATFSASEIDAPYEYDGAPPSAMYYGEGWWYPGYAYGYGPAFLLGAVGSTIVIEPPVVIVPPAPPSHRRGIEHPTPAHPVVRAPAPLPASAAKPPVPAAVPAYRAAAPEPRAPAPPARESRPATGPHH